MQNQNNKKILGTVLGLVLLVGAVLLISLVKRDVVPGPATDGTPRRMTISGIYDCLQPKDPNAPNTKECRPALHTDEGISYALDFNLMSQTVPKITSGDRVVASGTVTPTEALSSDMWQKYDMAGILSVTDGLKVYDPRDVSYLIEGNPSTVSGAYAYFGNEARGDFNDDGRQDVAFVITGQPGGSGTFYYVVAALGAADGYVGTNAVLLGDRIAPQSTEFGGGVIIANYAERAAGQPFSTAPSVNVSKYFTVEGATLVEAKK
jgi:hypothetical protein